MPNQLVTREQAAQYLGVKPHTLSIWACTKRYNLSFVKIGRCVRYRMEDLEAFIQANRQGAMPQRN